MVENLCRACLQIENIEFPFLNMHSHFLEEKMTINCIFEKIVGIENNSQNGLPDKICEKCFNDLVSSFNFQKKCIESDIQLKSIIKSNVNDEEIKPQIIKVETIYESEVEDEVDNWIYDDDKDKQKIISDDESHIERPNPKNKRKACHKCSICNKVFDRLFSFNRHQKSHKPGEILNFECEICKCKFSKEKQLEKHLAEKHYGSEVGCYPCPYCPRKFLKINSRSAHMQCHKIEQNSAKESGASSDESQNKSTIVKIGNVTEENHFLKEEKDVDLLDVKPLDLLKENSIEKSENIISISKNCNDDNVSDEVELPNPKNKRKAVHECQVCNKIFDRKYRLVRHLNIHNPEGRPFECEVCKWRFASEQNLTRHAITHTAVAECIQKCDKPKVYRCIYCPRKFAKKESLASHMRVHKYNTDSSAGVQIKNFKCQFCPKSFSKLTSLTRHLYRHDDEKNFECNLCSKTFSLRGQLVDHMNWHKGIKPFQCKICSKSFNQSCTLKDHMRTHSGEKPFLCSECGKGFNNSSNLRQHALRHTGERPFKCTECPSSFSSKGGLKSHMSTHTKLKPHVCDICGSSFTKRYSLKKHERIHTGEKPYECSTCYMRFTSSNHLKRHIRTHTGEKPYSCKYCDRAFAQSNDLVKHLKSHLGDKIYKCENCGESFRLQTELRDHQYQHYREQKMMQQQLLQFNKDIDEKISEKSEEKVNESEVSSYIGVKREFDPLACTVPLQINCNYCGSLFITKDELDIHEKKEHNKS